VDLDSLGGITFDDQAGTPTLKVDAVNHRVGIGIASPITKLDVRNGVITTGSNQSTDGSELLRGYYSEGALTVIGSEYSSGGPVIGYAVKPSTSANGAFLSSTSITVGRGAYSIDGNAHRWYGGSVQTVAENSSVTTNEVMRISSSGNVGIGTNNPTHRLVVYGTAQANEIRSSDGTVTSQWYQDSSGFGVFGTTSNHHQIFRTNGSEKMRISSGGYVGIGTSGPLDALHVHAAGFDIVGGNAINGQTMAGIKVTNSQNTDSSVGIWFGTTTSHWSGISGQRSNYLSNWGTDLRFYTHEDATNDLTYTRERVRITSSGNVGIGITNPATKLETSLIVQGQGAERYTPVDVLSISADNPGATVYGGFGQGLVFRGRSYNASTYRPLGRILHRIWDDSINTTLGSSLEFQTSNNGSVAAEPTTKMIIGYNGNVGIGTTNPGVPLDVKGIDSLIRASEAGSGTAWRSRIISQNPDGAVQRASFLGIYGTSAGVFAHNSTLNGWAPLFVNTTNGSSDGDNVILAGSGNVGIGTVNPIAKTHIRLIGDTAQPVLYLHRANNSGGGAGNPETGLEVNIPNTYNGAGTVYGVKVFARHNLGGQHYGGYFETAGSPYTSGIGVYAKTTHTDTNGPGYQPAILADAYSNIGTSNSGYAVGVLAQTNDYVNNINAILKSNYTGSSSQTALRIERNGSYVGYITTSQTTSSFLISSSSGLVGDSANQVSLNTNSTARITINSTGNVGIGTTNPTSKLSVQGSIDCGTSTDPQVAVRDSNGNLRAFEFYFSFTKPTSTGTAATVQILNVSNLTAFHQAAFTVEYGTRLQGISDGITSVCLKQFGVNKFNSGDVAITDTNDIASDTSSNNHANITCVTNGANGYIIRGEFSSSVGGSSFISGVIRGWGVADVFPSSTTFSNGAG
jgi:hypothetical protein